MSTLKTISLGLAAGIALTTLAGPALALDEVTFGTNWLAEAEHGGFYQAVADGTYEKYGLKVTIAQGGPQKDNRGPLLAGKIQFFMSGNMLVPLAAAQQDVPVLEVAAIFQKDPQVLLTHPDAGVETFADLSKLPTLWLSAEGFASYFQWMKQAYPGFSDAQYKPYNFDPQVFIVDPKSAMQGYITSEPYAVEKATGWKAKEFLLADNGFLTPSTMIETLADYADKNADIVQRFVDASIVGWYTYLYGDPSKGNAAIKADNPEMTDDQIAFSIAKMKEVGLVDSGIAGEKGIGCFSEDNQKKFYEEMAKAVVVPAGVDISKIYTNRFVCKKVGMDLKK